MSAPAVYRMYDANCVLLYVGHSLNVMQRLVGHSAAREWWSDVDTISVEHFATKQQALMSERAAIIAEAPLHNVNHTGELATQPKVPHFVTPSFQRNPDGSGFVAQWDRVPA